MVCHVGRLIGIIILLFLLQQCNTISASEKNLQDSLKEALFADVDDDKDGIIEPEEMAQYLQQDIGGESFDSNIEIEEGTINVFENIGDDFYDAKTASLDPTGIAVQKRIDELLMGDLVSYWDRMGSLMTVEEVADWVSYSVQLPMYNDLFTEAGITGFDFPLLLEEDENGRSFLEMELNITSKLHRKQLERSLRMKLFGISDEPLEPVNPNCKPGPGQINFSWKAAVKNGIPVHRYRVQRRAFFFEAFDDDDDMHANVPTDAATEDPAVHDDDHYSEFGSWSAWETIPLDKPQDLAYQHTNLVVGATFQYRVQAWNIIGHSPWTEPVQCTVIFPTRVMRPIVSPGVDIAEQADADLTAMEDAVQKTSVTPDDTEGPGMLMSTAYVIIDSYHALSAFIQVIVAVSATGSLLYYGFYNAYLKTNPGNEDVQYSDLPIPISRLRVASKVGKPPSISNQTVLDVNKKKASMKKSSLKGDKKTLVRAHTSGEIDLSYCVVCSKKLGKKQDKLGWRFKHFCHLCHGAFCHKDGISSHVRGFPCGVPSRCTCNNCLTQKTKSRQKQLLQTLQSENTSS